MSYIGQMKASITNTLYHFTRTSLNAGPLLTNAFTTDNSNISLVDRNLQISTIISFGRGIVTSFVQRQRETHI